MHKVALIASLSVSIIGSPAAALENDRVADQIETMTTCDSQSLQRLFSKNSPISPAIHCRSEISPTINISDSQTILHNSQNLLDLTLAGVYNPPTIAFGVGNRISFCPELSCVRGPGDGSVVPSFFDHQRASLLISGPSRLDAQAQEQLLAVIGTIATGYAPPWKAQQTYAVGENVSRVNSNDTGAVYRAIKAGRSGTSAPPAERPSNSPYTFTDGSVIWQWINDPAIAAKANVYNEQTVKAGAGSTWGQANNVHLQPGVKPSFHVNTEFDFGNDSGIDCGFGNGNCYNLFIRSGGANKLTSQVTIDSIPSGPYSAYFGLRVTGPRTAQLADIVTDSSGAVGLGICSSGTDECTHSTASINDKARSPVGLKLEGKYSGYAIESPGFSVDPQGFVQASGLNIKIGTPGSSRASCNSGDLRFDEHFVYVCASKNRWKRATLSDW